MLIGESMQQDGGVKKFRIESSPDLLATPFGAYDAAVIQAIQQRWFGLLEGLPSARNASGKVVVTFHLMSTGEVRDVEFRVDLSKFTPLLSRLSWPSIPGRSYKINAGGSLGSPTVTLTNVMGQRDETEIFLTSPTNRFIRIRETGN